MRILETKQDLLIMLNGILTKHLGVFRRTTSNEGMYIGGKYQSDNFIYENFNGNTQKGKSVKKYEAFKNTLTNNTK